MNFVIGDIHGELAKLQALIRHIVAVDREPVLIFIGDYLDKGEDPLGTLRYLQELSLQRTCVFLRGNHEYYWEKLENNDDEYASYLLKYGGQNTVASVGSDLSISDAKKKIWAEHRQFFDKLVNYFETENFVMTHSGIPPGYFDIEISRIPQEKLLFNRYDFISSEKFFFGKKIIFGHTGFFSPFYDTFKIGIDTAACYIESQPLTAFCAEGEFFIDSTGNRFLLNAIDLSCCPVIPRVKPWRQK